MVGVFFTELIDGKQKNPSGQDNDESINSDDANFDQEEDEVGADADEDVKTMEISPIQHFKFN